MDSNEGPIYAKQEGSAYNGHFDCACHHRCSCSRGSMWQTTTADVRVNNVGKGPVERLALANPRL
jgi:hypothetical protein